MPAPPCRSITAALLDLCASASRKMSARAPSAKAVSAKAAVAALRAKSRDSPVVIAAAAAGKGSVSGIVDRDGLVRATEDDTADVAAPMSKLPSVDAAALEAKQQLDFMVTAQREGESLQERTRALLTSGLTSLTPCSTHSAQPALLRDVSAVKVACSALLDKVAATKSLPKVNSVASGTSAAAAVDSSNAPVLAGWKADAARLLRRLQLDCDFACAAALVLGGDLAGGVEHLTALLKADPSRIAAWLLRGRAFCAMGGGAGLLLCQLHVDKCLSLLGLRPDYVADEFAAADAGVVTADAMAATKANHTADAAAPVAAVECLQAPAESTVRTEAAAGSAAPLVAVARPLHVVNRLGEEYPGMEAVGASVPQSHGAGFPSAVDTCVPFATLEAGDADAAPSALPREVAHALTGSGCGAAQQACCDSRDSDSAGGESHQSFTRTVPWLQPYAQVLALLESAACIGADIAMLHFEPTAAQAPAAAPTASACLDHSKHGAGGCAHEAEKAPAHHSHGHCSHGSGHGASHTSHAHESGGRCSHHSHAPGTAAAAGLAGSEGGDRTPAVLAARRAYVRGIKRAVMAGCVAWSNATHPSGAVLPRLRAEGVAPPEGMSEDAVLLHVEQRRLHARMSCHFLLSTGKATDAADAGLAGASDSGGTSHSGRHDAAVDGSCVVSAPAAPGGGSPPSPPLRHQYADRLLAEAYCLYAEGMHRGAWCKYLFAAHCLLSAQPHASRTARPEGFDSVAREAYAGMKAARNAAESAARPAAEHAAAEHPTGAGDASLLDLPSIILGCIRLRAASRVANTVSRPVSVSGPTPAADAGASAPAVSIVPAEETPTAMTAEQWGILVTGVEALLNAAACASRLPNVGNLRVACVPPAALSAAVSREGAAGAATAAAPAAETAASPGAVALSSAGSPQPTQPTSLLLPPPQALALVALQLLHSASAIAASVIGAPIASLRWLALRACHWLVLAPADTLQRPLLHPGILAALRGAAAAAARPTGVVSPAAAAVLPWLRWVTAELRPETPVQPSLAEGAAKAAASLSGASEAAQRQQRAALQRELAAICAAVSPLQVAPVAATNDARHPAARSPAELANTSGGSTVPARDADPGLTFRLWQAIF